MARHPVTAATVERLIASQFPVWSGLPVEAIEPGGWDNWTFRLGGSLIVRLPSAERYAPQVDKEHRWLPLLAPSLAVQIPESVGLGRPEFGYPWNWSIRRWLTGVPADGAVANDPVFAGQIADFLAALHRVDATSGPLPGEHNFHRGGALSTYDGQARDAIRRLNNSADASAAINLWSVALRTRRQTPAVWVHGDMARGNLLVEAGRLAAVIDWGNCAIGDPACDLAIAWTYLRGGARSVFRRRVPVDEATWDRAQGWALWKALILATGLIDGPAVDVTDATRVLREMLA